MYYGTAWRECASLADLTTAEGEVSAMAEEAKLFGRSVVAERLRAEAIELDALRRQRQFGVTTDHPWGGGVAGH